MKDRVLAILSELTGSLQRDRDLVYDAQEIWQELFDKGYQEDEIEATLDHIEKISLQTPGPFWSEHLPAYRIYNSDETYKVSSRARGYLWTLKSRGIIDHALEDEIVHKAMHLESSAGVREIKTVAALTLFGYEHKDETQTPLSEEMSSPYH